MNKSISATLLASAMGLVLVGCNNTAEADRAQAQQDVRQAQERMNEPAAPVAPIAEPMSETAQASQNSQLDQPRVDGTMGEGSTDATAEYTGNSMDASELNTSRDPMTQAYGENRAPQLMEEEEEARRLRAEQNSTLGPEVREQEQPTD